MKDEMRDANDRPPFPELMGGELRFDVVQRERIRSGRKEFVAGDPGAFPLRPLSDDEPALVVRLCEALLRRHGLSLPRPLISPFVTPPLADLVRYIDRIGIAALLERGQTLEDLAQHVEGGASVIVSVNVGELWSDHEHFDFGGANYAVGVVGIVRDAMTQDIVGAELVDPVGDGTSRLIGAVDLTNAWLAAGGWVIVAD